MSKLDSQLSTMTRKAVTTLEERFPELSKKYCPSRQDGLCEKTGRRCELESCPKMKKQLKEYL